jgi:hypothetical protein
VLLLDLPGFAAPCPDWTATRAPFFGDVHVHTANSFDATLFDNPNGPREAYRFAMGEPIGLPPLDEAGEPTRFVTLRRPLDFAAVTDHAEMLGETALCTDGQLSAPACSVFDGGSFGAGLAIFGAQFRDPDPVRLPFCGTNGQLCLSAAASVWEENRLAAEEFDDPDGDCRLTTFVGYEWTASPGGDNLHRNVLFRSGSVPPLPLSYVEVQQPSELWLGLRSQCETIGPGCEAITIPHNSNESRGQTFRTTEPDGSPLRFESALLRHQMEPLVELIQHKGDSECRPGVGTTDELCGFEKISTTTPEQDAPLSYVRNVLKAGLALDAQLGVNPFTLGLIASTDTHNATPGATREDDFPGHVGALDATAPSRLDAGSILQNPGGLMVLWAEENSRSALFDAMQRRESYATTGTRPTLRFFGGFDLPEALCGEPDLVAQAYSTGVPMGGELLAEPTEAAPRFVAQASQDPGSPGFPGSRLAEIQIIKGWLDANGALAETVISIVGGPPAPDALDTSTCEPDGSGAASFCAEWQDPDFDPEERAFYYARLLESPSCRWSAQLCRAEGIDCSVAPPPGFEACCDGSFPDAIQERATSTPIWVRPAPEPSTSLALAVGALALVASCGGRPRSGPRDRTRTGSDARFGA